MQQLPHGRPLGCAEQRFKAPMRTHEQRTTIRLADGRRLRYTIAGPADGSPVAYCHGAIGTPLGRSVDLETIAWALGVRHVSVSRPGIGGSDAAPSRSILDFASDLRELMGSLGHERFAIAGVSAGGPYALAAARELPDVVTKVAICSSLSPLCALDRTPGMQRRIRLALRLLATAPGLWATVGDALLPLVRRHPAVLSRVIAAHAAEAERELVASELERSAAAASFLDATAHGIKGLIEDYLIYAGEWGFNAAEVACEVHLWHGLRDPLVPLDHALELAVALPRCRVFFDPDEGHHFFRRRLREILGHLVGNLAGVGSSHGRRRRPRDAGAY